MYYHWPLRKQSRKKKELIQQTDIRPKSSKVWEERQQKWSKRNKKNKIIPTPCPPPISSSHCRKWYYEHDIPGANWKKQLMWKWNKWWNIYITLRIRCMTQNQIVEINESNNWSFGWKQIQIQSNTQSIMKLKDQGAWFKISRHIQIEVTW